MDTAARRLAFLSIACVAFGAQTIELVAGAGLVFAALAVLASRRVRELVAGVPWPYIAAYIAWSIVGPLVASGITPSGEGISRLFEWAMLPMLTGAWLLLDAPARRTIAWLAFVTSAVSILVAGAQHIGFWPSQEALKAFAWTDAPFYRVYEPVWGTDKFYGGGLLFHRLKFAHVTGLVALAAVWVVLDARVGRRNRVLAAALVAWSFVGIIVFAQARAAGGMLFAAAALLGLLTARNKARALVLTGLAGLAGIALIASIPTVRARFIEAIHDQSAGGREWHRAAGFNALRTAPVAGVGAGRFQSKRYRPENTPEQHRNHPGKAHEQFLSVAAETGLVGLGFYVAMIAALALALVGRLPASGLGLTQLFAFVLLSHFHDPLMHSNYAMGFMGALAMGFAVAQEGSPGGAGRSAGGERKGSGARSTKRARSSGRT